MIQFETERQKEYEAKEKRKRDAFSVKVVNMANNYNKASKTRNQHTA